MDNVMNTVRRTIVTGMRVDAIPSNDGVMAMISEALRNRKSFLMTFANPGTTVVVRQNNAAALFERFDVVAPDGLAMVKAIQMLHRLPAIRMSFDTTSLAPLVFRLAIERGSRVVLCGGAPGVAEQAAKQLRAVYPTLNIVGALHGYDTQATTILAIKRLLPHVVICGMGGLLQEKFLVGLADAGWIGVGFTCGGYLDQLSHGFHYYPKWINALNLRFAYRLAMEPRRLWRRYLLDYPKFVQRLGKDMVFRPHKAPNSQRTNDQL